MNYITKLSCDVLIIGSGVSGLSLALRLPSKFKITILSKGLLNECSTFYAQGGIAAVFDENDSIDSHVQDTLNVGAGIVDKKTAEFVVSNANHCIKWLIKQGVLFDKIKSKNSNNYHLNYEGGHSHRRILHTADHTGKSIETILINKVIDNPNIKIFEKFNVIDLILSDQYISSTDKKVIGALVWNINKEKLEIYKAKVVVLATGGASKVYLYTTNPDVSSGDGIAIGWRAGCRIANLEFNQFHPTTLFYPKSKNNFLITEALRGEGAYLKRFDGSRFMKDFDQREELAPRDIVTRAIDNEIKRLGTDCMYIDISYKPASFIYHHFPTIYKKLLKLGFDLTKDKIPIVPAAHYTCGGIVVDQYGKTDIDGLYAIGEVSYTGLHGANRIASNSLLECLVYSWSASEDICKYLSCSNEINKYTLNIPVINKNTIENKNEILFMRYNFNELRLLMWNYVGIVRTSKSLEKALHRISLLKEEIKDYYNNLNISNELLELRNLIQVAELIVRCALMRKESRGLHYILDYPEMIVKSGPSILSPNNINNDNLFKIN